MKKWYIASIALLLGATLAQGIANPFKIPRILKVQNGLKKEIAVAMPGHWKNNDKYNAMYIKPGETGTFLQLGIIKGPLRYAVRDDMKKSDSYLVYEFQGGPAFPQKRNLAQVIRIEPSEQLIKGHPGKTVSTLRMISPAIPGVGRKKKPFSVLPGIQEQVRKGKPVVW